MSSSKRYVVEIPKPASFMCDRYEFDGKGSKAKARAKLDSIRSGGNIAYFKEEEFKGGRWVVRGTIL